MDDDFSDYSDDGSSEYGGVSLADYGTGQSGGALSYALPDTSAFSGGYSSGTPSDSSTGGLGSILAGALSSGVFGGSPSLGDGFGGATGPAGSDGLAALTNGGGASGTNTLPDAGYTLSGKEGITHTGGTSSGSSSFSPLKSLASLVQDDKGNLDLTKLIKVGTGLGGVFEAYQRNKAAAAAKAAQLGQAATTQAARTWTPTQAAVVAHYFDSPQNRAPLYPSAGGIKSIVPASVTRPQVGYAGGGSVKDSGHGLVPLSTLIHALPLLLQGYVNGEADSENPDMADGGGVVASNPDMGGGALAATSPDGGGSMSHGTYGLITGAGDGQSDSIPINAAAGEYMVDAESVSMLGNGDNAAGAAALDAWREALREHKRSAPPDQIAPPTGEEQLPPTGAQ